MGADAEVVDDAHAAPSGASGAPPAGPAPSQRRVFIKPEQQELMAKWLAEAGIRPSEDCTQANFHKYFAAWLLEEDLDWTTGEAPSIARLFQFLESKYKLLSDTTVH